MQVSALVTGGNRRSKCNSGYRWHGGAPITANWPQVNTGSAPGGGGGGGKSSGLSGNNGGIGGAGQVVIITAYTVCSTTSTTVTPFMQYQFKCNSCSL